MEIFESPVSQVDVFDIVGVRIDGGVDTVIVCSGPLDSSDATLQQLELKARNYLREIATAEFTRQCGTGQVRIFVSCNHSISPEAQLLISNLADLASRQHVLLLVGKPVA